MYMLSNLPLSFLPLLLKNDTVSHLLFGFYMIVHGNFLRIIAISCIKARNGFLVAII